MKVLYLFVQGMKVQVKKLFNNSKNRIYYCHLLWGLQSNPSPGSQFIKDLKYAGYSYKW